MNLIHNPWIPAIRADGSEQLIAPWQLAESDNPVVELAAPRADFQGALYQFLIGLLQTAMVPDNEDDWLELWEQPPEPEQLQQTLALLAPAFELDNPDGPAFMQDWDLPDGEAKPVAALLIDAPGGKTIKDNLDHFVKAGQVERLCSSCAATALFTLQTNAPAGGVGHRVGLRGGGPLTTLVMPEQAESLWQKLWCNVLSRDFSGSQGSESPQGARLFPWMGSTRLSDKSGSDTLPEDMAPLHPYWGMPRRIRLEFEVEDSTDDIGSACCSLCERSDHRLVSRFRTKNYGINYDGPWLHPLTPYRLDLKHQKPPLSLKGQPNGLGYRHWLGLCWQDDDNGDCAARVVQIFNEERIHLLGEDTFARLWCFGYDMDNMKARCWYDSRLPLFQLTPETREAFLTQVASLLNPARDLLPLLRGQVKAAWFTRVKEVRGDWGRLELSFWQQTETAFYGHLWQLADSPEYQLPPQVAADWYLLLKRTALALFDQWVLQGEVADLKMKQVIRARIQLTTKLDKIVSIKALREAGAEAITETNKEVS